MSELERIQRYIDKTKFDARRPGMKLNEMFAIKAKADESAPFSAICLAFEYGLAKGYRAGKRETKK